ncbi:MAG: TonB-dependent receptor [Tannerella sp.]|nr:TonB-dependent receptor [Tannerella sp.]
MREINAGTLYPAVDGNKVMRSLLSYFGRVSYNYDRRYYLTATFRRDGSSKFMTKNKWANFPSASVAWQLANESFMRNQSLFGSLKLRAGWGQVGNQNLPSAVYESLLYQHYCLSGSNLTNTSHISTIRNEDIKRETVEDINFGVDFSLLNNSLSGSVEY